MVSTAAWEGSGGPRSLPLFRLDGGSSPPLIPCWLQAVQGANLTKRGWCPLTAGPGGRGELGLQQLQGGAAIPWKVRNCAALRSQLHLFPRWEQWSGRQSWGGGDGLRGAASPRSSQAPRGKESPPALGDSAAARSRVAAASGWLD